ncbi:gustatory receptor for sugar taste 64f-like isoform X2 [Periplaneta americana]
MLEWERLEHNQINYGFPATFQTNVQIISALVLLGGLAEHLLYNYSHLDSVECRNADLPQLLQCLIRRAHSHVLVMIDYSPFMALFLVLCGLFTTFAWNFLDLFIILISLALAGRFKLLNKYLLSIKSKPMPEDTWKQIRVDYNNLSQLSKTIDTHISKIILLSFVNNLYFICNQLLNSITLTWSHTSEALYFCWSLTFLIFRTVAVCLCASSIYEESRVPKFVLYAVPSESYSVEVMRFQHQVETDEIVLTAMNFFWVTRTLLLTLIGTIITYEIVLVQFSHMNT